MRLIPFKIQLNFAAFHLIEPLLNFFVDNGKHIFTETKFQKIFLKPSDESNIPNYFVDESSPEAFSFTIYEPPIAYTRN